APARPPSARVIQKLRRKSARRFLRKHDPASSSRLVAARARKTPLINYGKSRAPPPMVIRSPPMILPRNSTNSGISSGFRDWVGGRPLAHAAARLCEDSGSRRARRSDCVIRPHRCTGPRDQSARHASRHDPSVRPGRVVGPQARTVVGAARAHPRVGKLVKPGTPDFEVEMRAGGVASAGGFGDLLPARYLVPRMHAHGIFLEMIVTGCKNTRNAQVTNDNHVAAGKAPEAAAATGATIRTKRRAHRVPHLCVRHIARRSLAVGFVRIWALIVLAVEREQDLAIGRGAHRSARNHRLGADTNIRSFMPRVARRAAVVSLAVFVRVRITDAETRLIRNAINGPRQTDFTRSASRSR